MATENKRKSSRNFRLDKPVERKFELEKDEKDENDVITSDNVSQNIVVPSNEEAESSKGNNKIWIWLVAIVLIGLLIWWLIPSKEGISSNPDTVNEEQVDETPVNDDVQPTESTTQDDQEDVTTTEADEESVQATVEPEPAQTKPAEATTPSTSSKPMTEPMAGYDVEDEAIKVIRGDYGVGKERKDKLGLRYSEIQGKVNEMYRQKLVK